MAGLLIGRRLGVSSTVNRSARVSVQGPWIHAYTEVSNPPILGFTTIFLSISPANSAFCSAQTSCVHTWLHVAPSLVWGLPTSGRTHANVISVG